MIEPDGTVIEERSPTPIGNTASVPPGTMVTAPSAPPSGTTDNAPVVAVNTTPKWADPQFLIGILTAFSGFVLTVTDIVPKSGPISWRVTGPAILLAAIGAAISFLRHRTNTVTRG